jgi:teichoic acid transport system ATP-binding protein
VTEAALSDSSPPAPGGLVAVSVRNVDVRYRVYEEQFFSARELVARGFRSRHSTNVHAVRDVSFDVPVGEAVGIVGSNGSGKSTLLRAIAGLQSLAGGMIFVRGEAQLLGVGAALKPTLSGYRNVLLGGLAMGLSRSEIVDQMDSIVEFSGLGEAMGRPLNTYSSGMRARLAFSIATLRIPDILLIDEALAVGDKEFRERSLERIREIRDQAGTVIMVTHNLSEIRSACTRAIWLEDGEIVMDGGVSPVLTQYES